MNSPVNYLATVSLVILFATSTGCKKNEKFTPQKTNFETPTDYQRLLKFVSITSGIAENDLVFDKTTQTFILPKTVFKISIKEARENYGKANEYKLKYERHD